METTLRKIELPEDFVSYPEARKQAFLKMKEIHDSGRRIVGVFCSFTPWEIVEAADAVAVVLCGIGDDNIPAAETRLPANLCPLIKASYGAALTDRCPFLYFADMVLAETTCDGKKKMYELMGELKHCHIMQLPPGAEGRGVLDFWREEVISVKEDIEQFYGIEISDDRVREAIHLRNRERQAVLEFFEVARLKPSPVSGFELSTIISSNDYQVDLEEKIAYLNRRTAELRERYERELAGKPSRPRIIITGCPSMGVMDKVIKRIEELGADIVAFENCCGPREKRDPIDEELAKVDPYRAIAEKYLRVNCSVMSPNPGRMNVLSDMIDEYQADGVIEILLTACHTFAIESDLIQTTVEAKGIPYMAL